MKKKKTSIFQANKTDFFYLWIDLLTENDFFRPFLTFNYYTESEHFCIFLTKYLSLTLLYFIRKTLVYHSMDTF